MLVQLLPDPIEAKYEASSDKKLVSLADEIFAEYDKSQNPT